MTMNNLEIELIKTKKAEVNEHIDCHQKNISLLLDFAMGYKQLSWTRFKLKPYQKCDTRLLSTLKNLHAQIRELEKESDLLNQLLIKTKKEKANDVTS